MYVKLFYFTSADGWLLSTVKCSDLTRPCYHLELYSIVSRCVSRSFPSLAVRDARTVCRSARLHPLMIWNTYDVSCIIWKCFSKISLNSYYTRLYSNTCIHHVKPFTLPAWARVPLRICAGAGMSCRRWAVPGGTPPSRGRGKTDGCRIIYIIYIFFTASNLQNDLGCMLSKVRLFDKIGIHINIYSPTGKC